MQSKPFSNCGSLRKRQEFNPFLQKHVLFSKFQGNTLWKSLRKEQFNLKRLLFMVMALLITFSYSMIANAAEVDVGLTEGEEEIDETLAKILYPPVDVGGNDQGVKSDVLAMNSLDPFPLLFYHSLQALNNEPETYTVQNGDNLYRIALNHNISLSALMSWNSLSGELIHPGEVLIVSGDESDIEEIPIVKNTETVVSAPPKEKSQEQGQKLKTPAFKETVKTPPSSEGKEMTVTATAYTAYCKGCSGTTAYGIDLRTNPDQKVIAVDPSIIPLGTKVWVEGYGEAIAGDTGGAIKGNKIDVFIPSYDSAMEWGVKKVKIKVLN